MKHTLTTLTFLLTLHTIAFNQSYNCNNDQMAEFGPVSCISENGMDYLSVTLEVTNFNDCSVVFTLSGLPDDVSVDGQPIDFNDHEFNNDGSYDLTIPSDECADVFYNVSFSTSGCDPDCTQEFTNEVLSATRFIPTLGQWGLITLGFILVILGIQYIKIFEREKSPTG